MINPRADRALHRQLADLLRAQIADGALPPGTRLAGETQMAQEHGIGRGTVRRAIAILRQEGLVETEPPYGTRVRAHQLRTEVQVPGGAVWTVRMPTPAERDELDLGDGIPVVEVQLPKRRDAVLYPGDRHVFRNMS